MSIFLGKFEYVEGVQLIPLTMCEMFGVRVSLTLDVGSIRVQKLCKKFYGGFGSYIY